MNSSLARLASLAAAGRAAGAGRRRRSRCRSYYPVAVGGPITKIIDGMRRRLREGEPRHQGQARSTPAPTRSRSSRRSPRTRAASRRQLSVLLSTDMFTLIDEDAIVPFDDAGQDRRRQGWLKGFYTAFMDEQPDRRQDLGHPVPALDHRPVLQQGRCSRKPGSTPNKAPGDLGGDGRATRRSSPSATRSGNVTQWGVQIPSSGFPYWLFQGLTTQNDAHADERRRAPRPTTTSRR